MSRLRAQHLQKHYKSRKVVLDVSFSVDSGEVVGLLGPNGAGKTTTLRTIMGLWKASQGTVVFDGQPITASATPLIAGQGIAYVPENMGIFADLSVKENMLLAARGARTLADIETYARALAETMRNSAAAA